MGIQVKDFYAPKKYALSFNGSGKVQMSDKVIPAGEKEIIIEISKPSVPSGLQYILANSDGNEARHGEIIVLDTSGCVRWASGEGDGSYRFDITGATNICDGNRHVVKCVWDNTTTANAAKIYIDDILDGSGTASHNETQQGPYNLVVANRPVQFDRSLIGSLYGIKISGVSVVAWYEFREGSGTILGDSVSGYDGTITGATWVKL